MRKVVDEENKKLLIEGHFEKKEETRDDAFIQRTVTTVNKDKTAKLH